MTQDAKKSGKHNRHNEAQIVYPLAGMSNLSNAIPIIEIIAMEARGAYRRDLIRSAFSALNKK